MTVFTQKNERLLGQLARSFKDGIGRAVTWWWTEFQAVMPTQLVLFIKGPHTRYLTICATPDSIEIMEDHLVVERTSQFDGLSSNPLSQIFMRYRNERADTKFGIGMTADAGFVRTLTIPASARKVLNEILDQDLVHKMPFPKNSFFQTHVVQQIPGDNTRLRVQHIIVRRSLIERAASRLGMLIDDFDFVRLPYAEAYDPAIVPLRHSAETAYGRLKPLEAFAVGLGVLLFLTAFSLYYFRQATELGRLNDEIARLRPMVMEAQSSLLQSRRHAETLLILRMRKQNAGVTGVLEELTKALPDDSWLQSVEINEVPDYRHQVTIAGYAGDATSLVGVLNKSNAFVGAAITSAVALDPIEKRERFTLRVLTKDLSVDHRIAEK